MYNRIKKIIPVVVVLAMMATLTACASAPEPTQVPTETATEAPASAQPTPAPVSLRLYAAYTSDDDKAVYDYAKAAADELFPNVTITLEIDPQDDHQKLKTEAASGNLPDIFPLTSDLTDLFKKGNCMVPLNEYLDQQSLLDILTPAAASLLNDADGNIYSIPMQFSLTELVYINKDLFSQYSVKIPQNYDELMTAVQTFKDNNITPLSLFAKEKWPGVQLFDMIATRTEPAGYQKLQSGEAKITDAVYLDAAQKIYDLVNAGLVSSDCFTMSYDAALADFESGKSAFLIDGNWDLKAIGDKMGDSVDYLYPSIFGDATTAVSSQWSLSGGSGPLPGYAVASTCEDIPTAVNYMTEFALKMAEARAVKLGQMNTVLKTCPPPETPYNALQQKFADDSANFGTMSYFDWDITDQKLKVALEDNCQALLTGSLEPADFISNVEKGLAQ